MNNDLISRDYVVMVYNRVKEACKNCDNYNGVRCRACDIGDELLDLQDIIDNAPAVEAEKAKESEIIKAYTKGFDTGVETVKGEKPQGEPVIKCQDCKYRVKEWREDKRMKEKGYWVYGCKHFGEIIGFWGFGGNDNEFCSYAEQKGGAE